VSIPDRRTVLRSGLAVAALGQWAPRSFGGEIPGPEIRVRKGQILQALLVNGLPVETTVHWHGVAIRNDMDGVPGMTQAPVPSGQEFTYSFAVAEFGTYWYHPHVGVQLDRGLYGPLIVEDPSDPADYDHDWTIVLDDWIDGTGYTPDQVLDALRNGMSSMSMAAASPSPMMSSMNGMSGMPMPASPGSPGSPGATPAPSPVSSTPPSGPSPVLSGARSALLGGDAGDVRYPWYLINGRVRTAPRTFSGRPGQRARIRFINAAADTSFRVALGGHQMTVTHTDGYPVAPVRADALLIGMGSATTCRSPSAMACSR
jgi:FtsP/CotA-like multicopper oxidase with cupredoxin domain